LKANTAEVKQSPKPQQAPTELHDEEELPAINDRIDPVTRRASVAPHADGETNNATKQNAARIVSQQTTPLKEKAKNDNIELDSSDEENDKNK